MKLDNKKILYVDMDNVLVDFQSGIDKLDYKTKIMYEGRLDEVPGIFGMMGPVKGAIECYTELCSYFDTYVLSTTPWLNDSAASDKLIWIKKYLGQHAYKRLILSHHKHLNIGDYLIDDRDKNGADKFTGELIKFGSAQFPDWNSVREYLLKPLKKP